MVDIKMLSLVLSIDAKKAVFDLKTIHKNIRTDVKPSEFVVFYNGTWNVVNIYELAHKCKVLAYNLQENIIIESCTLHNAGACKLIDKMGFVLELFDAKSEIVAIFKATQWILDNKDKL